ncbi:hypothetical protein B0G81_2377 [Paraburkholderia sp. BL6665CI2N2]|uniref:hypothetical protein n=1 Tax=Paraburkholderia sp. BL6665CI2N2 TaxID=1938806 RepID=UPI001065F1E8|nr:hypothetical protein [Paraburkholderia sp. BL6665CI2N2]TDY22094.1 hypothetical protein B0G81_2377 [Paraburkholderia sp. BL6665CI2N2]
MRIVENRSKGGNHSVLGLGDWDGERSASSRIHVLSPNVRNGIESLMLDPVLVAAVVAREHLEFAHKHGILFQDEHYALMGAWDEARWQKTVDTVQKMVLGTHVDLASTMPIEYLSGKKLIVSKVYLHMDDHTLQERVVECFAF